MVSIDKEELIKQLKTPVKTNRLLIKSSYQEGDFDSHAVDCPFVFLHQGRYYMTYVGWDSIGYRTGLAVSDNLLDWEKEGMIIDRGAKGTVTEYNIALTSILRENNLSSKGSLKKVRGQYLGTYHAYPGKGYETGPGVIGLCYSDNLKDWEIGDPVLFPGRDDQWDAGGLYKSWIMEYQGQYYLFYNAKNINKGQDPWHEQIGLAVSSDLKNWQKHPQNPLLKIGKKGAVDDIFVADPCVLKYKDYWLMFYYVNSTDGHARDTVAFSTDLVNWQKADQVLIDIGKAGSVDAVFAHKPAIITKDNKLYHFYCAASPKDPAKTNGLENILDIRGISLAHN